MDKMIEAFFSVFSEFTWRRFLALLIMVAVLFLGFSFYERYTSSFRLTRLQKSAELLIKIHEMERATMDGSPELQRASRALVEQSIRAVEIKPISLDVLPSTLRFSTDYLWKFLAGCAAWVAFAASRVPRSAATKSRELAQLDWCSSPSWWVSLALQFRRFGGLGFIC